MSGIELFIWRVLKIVVGRYFFDQYASIIGDCCQKTKFLEYYLRIITNEMGDKAN